MGHMNSLLRVAEWGAVAAPSAVSVADSPQTTLDTPVSDTPAVSASSPTVARGNRLPSLVTESTLVSSVDALILGSFASASAGTAQTHDLADTGERIHRNSDLLKISMKASRFEDKYERRELIGQGGHGKVFLCVSRSTEDSLKYAVKDVDVNRLQLIPGFDKKKLRREVDILMSIDHPNIVYCYECFESASNHMLMILEYCEGRDLVDIITERVIADSCFADAEAKSIVRQINSAVMYLHSHKIMHRDLKCDNIRVLESRTLSPHFNDLKLLDFGYSKFTAKSVATSWAGTPDYMAPEVDDVRTGKGGSYAETADCWSLGVILYLVLMLDFPRYDGNDKRGCLLVLLPKPSWATLPEKQKKAVPLLAKRWASLSDGATDLISKLLSKDPKKRLSAAQILLHEWMTSKE